MKNEKKKNNIISFPGQLSTGEREVEAILFAAAEPLEIETIEDRISKKIDVKKILKKLEDVYFKIFGKKLIQEMYKNL